MLDNDGLLYYIMYRWQDASGKDIVQSIKTMVLVVYVASVTRYTRMDTEE